MDRQSDVEQPLDQPLSACRERNAGVSWPLPIHERLDQLIKRANRRGAAVDRKTLSAAIIMAASEDPEELLERVLAYRTATAGQAMIEVPEGAKVVSIARHKPGPRAASVKVV